jgi:hypothetical protein
MEDKTRAWWCVDNEWRKSPLFRHLAPLSTRPRKGDRVRGTYDLTVQGPDSFASCPTNIVLAPVKSIEQVSVAVM